MDFWISQWISGFHSGFLDFWISVWISADGVRDFFRDGPLGLARLDLSFPPAWPDPSPGWVWLVRDYPSV